MTLMSLLLSYVLFVGLLSLDDGLYLAHASIIKLLSIVRLVFYSSISKVAMSSPIASLASLSLEL